MKKTLVFLIIIIVVIAGFGFYYLNQSSKQPDNRALLQVESDNPPVAEKTDHPYVGDDFTFIPPQGWIQTSIPSTLVAYQNAQETQAPGSAAAKINFKSYLAVSFDNVNGQDANELKDLVKRQIQSVAPGVSFISETERLVDDRPAVFLEADLLMQDVDFKILMVIIMGEDKYFTLSGNTTMEMWTDYRDIFYAAAESFKIKN